MSGYKLGQKLRLGYYNQEHFLKDEEGELYAPFDIVIWANRFKELCEEFVCFLNNGGDVKRDEVPKSFHKMPTGVAVVDIGPQSQHRKKGLGIGLKKENIKVKTKDLDVIIVQGPTPQQYHIAKNVHPNCKIASLLVGMMVHYPKNSYKFPGFRGIYREWFKNRIKDYTNFYTTRVVNKYADISMGNNPGMKKFYKIKQEFNLVSKGLIKNDEIVTEALPENLGEELKLIFYSRLDPEKNAELLIKAVYELKKKGKKVLLDIYGGSALSEYDFFLQELVKELKVEDEVKFCGGIPNTKKVEIFRGHDLYIFNTCNTEGFPRTVWEAFAAGIPTICSAYLGAREFFVNNEVLFYDQNNLQQLIDNIERLEYDYALRQELVQNARNLLQENTMEKSTQHIYNLLEDFFKKGAKK